MASRGVGKWWTAAGVVGAVLLVDVATKTWIKAAFRLGDSVPVLGDTVRLTYVINPGAAFGIHVGPHSRLVFSVLAVAALALVTLLLRSTRPEARGRVTALALVAGGALGNLLDRIVGSGVIDFLDVGFGALRWPIFNVADVGVTTGAVLLVALLWDDEGRDPRREAAEDVPDRPRGAPNSMLP